MMSTIADGSSGGCAIRQVEDFYPEARGRSFLIVGASGSGKSSLVFQMIDSWRRDDPSINDRIIVLYTVYQQRFYEGLDAREGIDSLATLDRGQLRNKILVLDDLQNNLREHADSIERIFSIYAHHLPMTIIVTIQNLIQLKLPNIVKNASYIAVLRSRQSAQTLRALQSSLFPYCQRSLIEAQELNPYRLATLSIGYCAVIYSST